MSDRDQKEELIKKIYINYSCALIFPKGDEKRQETFLTFMIKGIPCVNSSRASCASIENLPFPEESKMFVADLQLCVGYTVHTIYVQNNRIFFI